MLRIKSLHGNGAARAAYLSASLIEGGFEADIPAELRAKLGIPQEPSRLTLDDFGSGLGHLLNARSLDGHKVPGRHYAVSRTKTLANGQPLKLSPVTAYDFTFSPDKSVSLVAFFTDKGREVLDVHRRAVAAAMQQARDVLGLARSGHGGAGPREAGAVGFLRFDHGQSRPVGQAKGDPQLHSHTIVLPHIALPNRVAALSTGQGYRQSRSFRNTYHRTLGDGLRRLGLDVAYENGIAKVRGIASDLLQQASRRRRQIVEHAGPGATPGQRNRAAVASRSDKGETKAGRHDWPVLASRMQQWERGQSRSRGIEPPSLGLRR
jgi:conjugative relaxase-like TrwC/TraI family protein